LFAWRVLASYSVYITEERAAVNIYVDLTNEFNTGELRAILSSGQAVVLHELAVMSKAGDWILREAHTVIAALAEGVLPLTPKEVAHDRNQR